VAALPLTIGSSPFARNPERFSAVFDRFTDGLRRFHFWKISANQRLAVADPNSRF
jgi:hypothetical protein